MRFLCSWRYNVRALFLLILAGGVGAVAEEPNVPKPDPLFGVAVCPFHPSKRSRGLRRLPSCRRNGWMGLVGLWQMGTPIRQAASIERRGSPMAD